VPRLELEELREKEEPAEEAVRRLEEEQIAEDHGHLPPGRGCNLYLAHNAETTFVAALGARDNQLGRNVTRNVPVGVWQGELGSRTAQVAGGGRELVFQSTQELTGYDNSTLADRGVEYGAEVFVYNTDAGGLVCASCDPAGAPPTKEVSGIGAGTYLPISLNPTSMRRWVSADGSRVFFDSSQPLVPQDSNGSQDIYEWEREGTEGCPVATSKWGGCASLLSGGEGSDLSFFIDASADGADVFFTHRGQLQSQGRPGGGAEVFDARANGGFPVSSIGCTGTGCQSIPQGTTSFATPPSATFSGVGNFSPSSRTGAHNPPKLAPKQRLEKALKICKRKASRRKRVACGRRARKRYGSMKGKGKKAKRASKGSR
jgi:hypothetical protein